MGEYYRKLYIFGKISGKPMQAKPENPTDYEEKK